MLLQAFMHSLRPLTQSDLPALLTFERHNRAYFEQWVPPRPAWFFNDPSQFAHHMATLFEAQKAGTFLMFITSDRHNKILGRLNITNEETPSLGYRVAQAHAGKGIASHMVQHACVIAKASIKAARLTAQAAANNPASQHVLKNNGFVLMENDTQPTTLNGQTIWLERFHKRL